MDLISFLASNWYGYVLIPFLIFTARIFDVSLGTIRVICIAKGYKPLSKKGVKGRRRVTFEMVPVGPATGGKPSLSIDPALSPCKEGFFQWSLHEGAGEKIRFNSNTGPVEIPLPAKGIYRLVWRLEKGGETKRVVKTMAVRGPTKGVVPF